LPTHQLAHYSQMNLSVSPRVVAQTWRALFEADTRKVLDGLSVRTHCDLVSDFAMPVSANALRRITGLMNMNREQIDAASQGMIDGISNYSGNEAVEAVCKKMTALIDRCIDEKLKTIDESPDMSLLNTLAQAGQPLDSIRANIKLAISGGQNEPRDAIAGTAWAVLNHPAAIETVSDPDKIWRKAFEEFARWISPIGMSPRRIAKDFHWNGINLEGGQRAFFMYGSGNRDEKVFDQPDSFDINRNNNKSISFGAGPHFCAGASVSRCLIGDVALPLLFARFPAMRIDGDVKFGGWAFRGPLKVPVRLQE